MTGHTWQSIEQAQEAALAVAALSPLELVISDLQKRVAEFDARIEALEKTLIHLQASIIGTNAKQIEVNERLYRMLTKAGAI